MALKRTFDVQNRIRCLATETIEGSALPLQSIDDIHGGDGLPLSMLGVGDSITDDIAQGGQSKNIVGSCRQRFCQNNIANVNDP